MCNKRYKLTRDNYFADFIGRITYYAGAQETNKYDCEADVDLKGVGTQLTCGKPA
jgi:hypothetical protein